MMKPLIVALTGGIGSGKSTVADLFATLATPIIDADVISRQLIHDDPNLLKQIVDYFGCNIVMATGELDRRQLRTRLFNSATEKRWLEQLLHPLIFNRLQRNAMVQTANYVIVVIPLLAENGKPAFIDRVIVVDTSVDLQRQRASQRDQTTIKQIQQIMQHQCSRAARLAIADDIIYNQGNRDDLVLQVQQLHQFYQQLTEKF